MYFKGTGCYRLAVLFCLLVGGCASQLQKTLDRSIMIEERCTAIEEALPVENEKLKDALMDAVTIRLVGTCLDGQLSCLDPASGQTSPPPLDGLVDQLKADLSTYRNDLKNVNMQFREANKSSFDALENEYVQLDRDLQTVGPATKQTLSRIYDELKAIKAKLTGFVDATGKNTCDQRTDCVALFARQFASDPKNLNDEIVVLKGHFQSLKNLVQRVDELTARSARVLAAAHVAAGIAVDKAEEASARSSSNVRRSAQTLAMNSEYLAERLEGGTRAISGLFASDVQAAATDFMAARLYGKAADRILNVVDRMLSQLDRAIDKIDDHAYGGASAVMLFLQGDTQERFDRIYTEFISSRFKSKTAQLAFAAAACRRLGVSGDTTVKNSSMFSPFLFAALTRVEYEIGDRRVDLAKIRENWEQRVGKTFTDLKAANLSADDSEFRQLASAALKIESSKNAGQVAPTMLQQVALCAGVEQQFSPVEGLSAKERTERTLRACGTAVADATLVQQPLPQASSPALAQQAIENVPPPLRNVPANNYPGTEDAKAWRNAMEAVLAASAPKQTGQFELLCQKIKGAALRTRCEAGGAANLTLEFDASFGLGKREDRNLELQLARLANLLDEGRLKYRITVYGYASAKSFPCSGNTSTQSACGPEKNRELARARAKWALGVLKKRLNAHLVPESVGIGIFNPLSFDTPADRQLRIVLELGT